MNCPPGGFSPALRVAGRLTRSPGYKAPSGGLTEGYVRGHTQPMCGGTYEGYVEGHTRAGCGACGLGNGGWGRERAAGRRPITAMELLDVMPDPSKGCLVGVHGDNYN
ncbi:MAG: hypothetical protein MdMp014T_1095 [Treponematales bacterium]